MGSEVGMSVEEEPVPTRWGLRGGARWETSGLREVEGGAVRLPFLAAVMDFNGALEASASVIIG